eukprot:gnl/MRDRNA2_/MRDRNA2_191248_c0_seq1.p1 gnl/MRDRNA2_/MRDRNA2_191248_c0~~gnl/MRDRNA2_/MRDRNA2_191248_c0_seq1.p1  ORF type:complete len:392 (+),score=70.11 gnl/MRDRNA2_/MRDRNA2_191248_c0_seq1:144-1178(+)
MTTFQDDAGNTCTKDAEDFEEIRLQHFGKLHQSKSCMIAAGESVIADQIAQIIEEHAGFPHGHSYHLQVLKYSKEEDYTAHTDCDNTSNDRSGTALVYLTDVEDGGETCFTKRGLCVKPRKGTGLFFQSLNTQGACDELSQHLAAPVVTGSKVVLQRWYHKSSMIPGSFEDHVLCDHSQNCRMYTYHQGRAKAGRLQRQGSRLKERGHLKKAEAKFEAAILAYSTYHLASALHAEVMRKKDRLAEAVSHFRNALVEAPLWDVIHLNMGNIYQDMDRLAESASHLRSSIKIQPSLSKAWIQLGRTLSRLPGREVEALQALDQHLVLSPGDSVALQLRRELMHSEL